MSDKEAIETSKLASEWDRKLRSGSTSHRMVLPPLYKHIPRVKKASTCPECGMPLWVGKTPRVFRCPSCRTVTYPCVDCGNSCEDLSACSLYDGEYIEEAVGWLVVDGSTVWRKS